MSQALDALSVTGLPVDGERQTELREYIMGEELRLNIELQALIPDELRPLSKKDGYKGLPKDLRAALKAAGLLVPKTTPLEYYQRHTELCEELGYVRRLFQNMMLTEPLSADKVREPFLCERLVKLLPFNPDSGPQILSYLKYKGYRIPLHIDTKRPTTGQKEIENLILDTGDPALKVIAKAKKLTKLGGTYCSGYWIPGEDGRVHGQFRFGTTTGQTSCANPNVQQWPEHYDPDDEWLTDIMKRVKGCIKAEPGHVFVKVDAKGAHSRMQAFLAEDADYYRLANLGTHAFNTAHHVGLPDKDTLLALDDSSLKARLKEIKKAYEYEYSFVKRVSFLMQYLGGAQKAALIMRMPTVEVQALIDMIKAQFPRSFVDFPKSVARRLREHPWLISPFGFIRYFWDLDIQQAVAFSVANPFHAHWQSALLRLYDKGVFSRFEAVNFRHDDLWLHPLESEVAECIEACKEEMEKPSDVLVNSLGSFQVDTEASVGYDMASIEDA